MRRRNRELSILPEIARELSARLEINELLDVALRRSVETLGAMVGHIIIFNPGGPLHKEYQICTPEAHDGKAQLPPLNDLLQQLKENPESILIENTQNDPLWKSPASEPARSAIIAPLTGRLELLGLFLLVNEQPDYFNLEHELLLQAIASQTAIAVENSRLYAEVMQKEQKLSAILHSAADAIIMFEADGSLAMLNPAAKSLFADHPVKLGLPLAKNCGYDALITALEEVLTCRQSINREIYWPDQRVFSVMFTPIDEGGCVVLLHDVSQFKALEHVKNEFIATASHDLKNPIAAITGFTALLPRAGALTDLQADFVQRIQSAAACMDELVQNMLSLARIDANMEFKRESVDMKNLAAEIVHEFEPQAQAKAQILTLYTAENNPEIQGDTFQLKQALRNLVGNAMKYTPAKGTITISVACDGHNALIEVKDTGYGIPGDDLPHIFDRFYRVHQDAVKDIEGNGLGLAIVKSIIKSAWKAIWEKVRVSLCVCRSCKRPLHR
jgi:signal transduction histidine kinase